MSTPGKPTRTRHESIGALGRAPARANRPAPVTPRPPPKDPTPEPGLVRTWIHGALFDNVGLKFLSMVLAVTVFLLVNTDRDREINARIGVSYNMPDDKVLISERVDEIRVTVKGPWRRLRRFDQREVDPIAIDLRRAPAGDIQITPDMIHLPAGLTVASISPRSIRVTFDRRVEKLVEVEPQLVGRPQHGYIVSEIKPVPATIKVRGADSTLAAITSVPTREVPVEGRTESFTMDTEVVMPEGVEPVGGAHALLHITVDEELVTRKLPGLVVGVKGDGADPAKWEISPAQVEVTLTGTLLAVEKAKAALSPIVKLSGNDTRAREADVSIEGLPPGIGVKISPERVKITPIRAGASTPTPTP